jgi:7-carboxy-7-deazaguanine synthase
LPSGPRELLFKRFRPIVLVSEIFHSIQGEGSLLGMPSVFVRLSGCNLRCNWCDTPYASWHPEGEEIALDSVVESALAHRSSHVVLTGGEPMMAKEIGPLAAALRAAGRHITIETAATLPPEGIACDLASLSPKLANSRPDERLPAAWAERHEARRRRPEVIAAWIKSYDYQLKFVVSSPEDLAEIEQFVAEAGADGAPEKIFLMPEGVTMEALRQRSTWLVDLCLQRGYRYAHRLHIELFGNTRGT